MALLQIWNLFKAIWKEIHYTLTYLYLKKPHKGGDGDGEVFNQFPVWSFFIPST